MAKASDTLRMPAGSRLAVYLVLGALWLSGCVWLLLDEFFESRGPFGVSPHPWEGAILALHGILAIISTFLFGWLTARHVLARWPGRLRRLSGATLAMFFALLTLSGFALFFIGDDRWQRLSAVAHDALGLGVLVFAIQHWFFAKRRDIRSAASRPW
jgi:hypothetical protein